MINTYTGLVEDTFDSIGSVTLVGCLTDSYPVKHGNCFGVISNTNKKEYRIVNFYLENLEHLIEEKIISYPIKIQLMSNNVAIIADERIPLDFFNDRICEICCPHDLLPINQKLKFAMKVASGAISVTETTFQNGDSPPIPMRIISQKVEVKERKLSANWQYNYNDDGTVTISKSICDLLR